MTTFADLMSHVTTELDRTAGRAHALIHCRVCETAVGHTARFSYRAAEELVRGLVEERWYADDTQALCPKCAALKHMGTLVEEPAKQPYVPPTMHSHTIADVEPLLAEHYKTAATEWHERSKKVEPNDDQAAAPTERVANEKTFVVWQGNPLHIYQLKMVSANTHEEAASTYRRNVAVSDQTLEVFAAELGEVVQLGQTVQVVWTRK